MSPDYGSELSHLLDLEPYSLPAAEKSATLLSGLGKLTEYHRRHCPEYARILEMLDYSGVADVVADIPFLPVRLFKEFDLLSVDRQQVFKTMTSSGTSGQQVSRIFLDRETAAMQSKVLARLMREVLGRQRLPMLIVDSPGVLRDRQAFSARGAGILGFSLFGRDVTYALDESMQPDWPTIDAFLARHRGESIFVFGFTFMVWQHLCLPLRREGRRLALDGGILLHGGGWKKLQQLAIDNAHFKAEVSATTGIGRVVNYYGMVEQTGSICLECERGHLHTSVFSDVLVRDATDFSLLPPGQSGLLEMVSLLPLSYPGHALLTEDQGMLLGEDDCPCGRLGRFFSVAGRIPRAELRGCSDTYAVPV